MKLNKKMKASLLVGLSSTLVLASVPLLNSNTLATAYKNDNTSKTIVSKTTETDNSRLNDLNPVLDPSKIIINKDSAFNPDVKELGFFGKTGTTPTATEAPSFWFDTSSNTLNIDTSKEVVDSATQGDKITEQMLPNIKITKKDKEGKESTHTIKAKKTAEGSKITWDATDLTKNGWTQEKTTGKANTNKYTLTLKDGETVEVRLTYLKKTSDNTNLFKFKKTGNTQTFESADTLNIKSKQLNEFKTSTQKAGTTTNWTQYEQAFVMEKQTVKNSRSKRDLTKKATATSTLLFPTNHNYSKATVDSSASIRNLGIEWNALWAEGSPQGLHTSLGGKTGGKALARNPATNIFTFNSLTKDSTPKIDSAYGWVDLATNTYSLKYSGTVKNGYDLEKLYDGGDYKVKDQKFDHVITMDFNSKGITRTDLSKSPNTIPSYVFDVEGSAGEKTDPYAVVPGKNPQKIGLDVEIVKKTGGKKTNTSQPIAWIDQNGLNLETKIRTGNETNASHRKYSISYTRYDANYKEIGKTKTINAGKVNTDAWDLTTDLKNEFLGTKTDQTKPFLIPVSENAPILKVYFKYHYSPDGTPTGATKTPLKYVEGTKKAANITSPDTWKDASKDLKITTKVVDTADSFHSLKETKVILYRGADGMNHMMWDTSPSIGSTFSDPKAPAANTNVKSEYSINTDKLSSKIKELSSQGQSLEQIITMIKTDPSFAKAITVNGHNAPNINITMTPNNDDNSIKFNVAAKNLDATGIVTSNKGPLATNQDVLINGQATTEFFINKDGSFSDVPFSSNKGLPGWGIALIVISVLAVVGASVFAFIKYRKKTNISF